MRTNDSSNSQPPKGLFASIISKLKKLTGEPDSARVDDDAIRRNIGGSSATSDHRKPPKSQQ